jgi:hypothetical protein
MSIEAMKQALDALEYAGKDDFWRYQNEAITSLRQAIEQAEKQEPVAWIEHHKGGDNLVWDEPNKGTPLYTHPQPKREWVGLTDEEIEQGCKESWVTLQAWQSAVWWAEAKLKEKNT